MTTPSFLYQCFSLLVAASWLWGSLEAAQNAFAHDGCLQLPVIHSTDTRHFKRAVEIQVANRSDVAYYVQLNIGTPPQPVYVQIDTGSFELWVNADCNALSDVDQSFCRTMGIYDTSKSSTGSSLNTGNTLRYGIGTANITYFKDSISVPGSRTSGLTNVQFGVAMSTADEFSGILGLGYGKGITTNYPNFLDMMYQQSATKVKAYSLALGSKDEKKGVLVFGGIDTSKFSGRLAKLPILPARDSPDGVPRYWVNMEGLALTSPSGHTKHYSNSSMPVFMDSGSTMTLLPQALADAVAKDFGVDQPDSTGFYAIDCSLTKLNGTLDFVFDGMTVRVSYREMAREVPGNPPTCFLGISPSTTFTLLGDTFMRSAYAVFDLESDAVWLAQSTDCGSTPAALGDIAVLSEIKGACADKTVGKAANRANSGDPSAKARTATMQATGTQAVAVASGRPTGRAHPAVAKEGLGVGVMRRRSRASWPSLLVAGVVGIML